MVFCLYGIGMDLNTIAHLYDKRQPGTFESATGGTFNPLLSFYAFILEQQKKHGINHLVPFHRWSGTCGTDGTTELKSDFLSK